MNRLPRSLNAALLLSVLLAFWGSCVPVREDLEPDESLAVDYKDPLHRHVYDLQDRLEVDSLIRYLGDDRADIRFLAARAFGSVLSEKAVEPLQKLLLDPNVEIREAAAYAIGQQNDSLAIQGLIASFEQTDTSGAYALSNAAILEAAGKIGNAQTLKDLVGISTYRDRDSLLHLGRLRGIYRLGLRKIHSPAADSLMLEILEDEQYGTAHRILAAHYLNRITPALSDAQTQRVNSFWKSQPNPEIRLPLVLALRKSSDSSLAFSIPRLLSTENDPRVRMALIRLAGPRGHALTREMLLEQVKSERDWDAIAAAEQLRLHGRPEDATLYWRMAKDSVKVAEASAQLYGAALRHLPAYYGEYRNYINAEMRRNVERLAREADQNPKAGYEQGVWIAQMAEWPWNYRYFMERSMASEEHLERTVLAEALLSIASRPDVVAYFKNSFPAFKREMAWYVKQIFQRGDPGEMAVAAQILAIQPLYFRTEFENLDFLEQAKTALDLPRELETFYALEEARAVLEPGYTAKKPLPEYNHPINWDIYRSLQPGIRVLLETSAGPIEFELLEEEAPATVVSFIQLVRNGYFNDKLFHRIVPGFVAQGGCPRGDGYGSLDYTIRSETGPLHYSEAGYVGMASAGRHTEGVQFFITQAATPHLDGRYTIFGKVISGMDALLSIRPGDGMHLRLR